MKRPIIAVLLLLMVASTASALETGPSFTVSSPDGRYEMSLTEDSDGGTKYSLKWDGRVVVEPSSFCIELSGKAYGQAQIKDFESLGEQDSTWDTVYGEYSSIRDHYNSARLSLEGTPFVVEIRAYNEGVAFRYDFIGGSYLNITDERTEFTLPEGTQAYFTPRAQSEYTLMPLHDWPAEAERPLLLRLPQEGFLCLAEAQMVDYARGKFRLSSSKPNTIQTALYGTVDDIAPYQSPWRVMMCGHGAGEIAQHNTIMYNLNAPCELDDTSWIRPGKVMREVTLTTEGGKALVDFAVKRHLQYIHFDAGWYGSEYSRDSDATTVTLDPKRNPQIDALDLQEVISYAASKGIGVILYVNQRALQQQLDEILPLYEQWGVAGVKFGFVQVGSQAWTRWLHEAVRECAEHHLMVDIHDEYRPTGYSRTYPNLMTQEGVRGNEEFPSAFNNTMLPFTRFVAGPADYTICYYRQDFGRLEHQADDYGVPRSRTIQTTPSHQLALSVVYYSPLQYMYWYDKPSDCQDEPELKFFDDVYTVWDDTRILEGEPGEYISTARRHGDEWFIGTITNEQRRAELGLDFLEDGDYIAEIYTDGDSSIPTRTKVRVSRYRVTPHSVLRFDLKDSGGAAIRIVRETSRDKSIKNIKNNTVL